MSAWRLQGELEVDPRRGVIYFHATEPQPANAEAAYTGRTILRIQGLGHIPYNTVIDMNVGGERAPSISFTRLDFPI